MDSGHRTLKPANSPSPTPLRGAARHQASDVMQSLLPPIRRAFNEDFGCFRPGSTLGDVAILRYLHTIEKRGTGSFAFHECLALGELENAGPDGFILCIYNKARKGGWALMALECGDRNNPPPPGFQCFDRRPSAADIRLFIDDRHCFRPTEDQCVLSSWTSDELDSLNV